MNETGVKQRIREYFDRVAESYQWRVTTGVLSWIRTREKKAVLEALEPKSSDTILDAGCGSGFYSLEIKRRGANVLGVDISQRMVESARKSGVNAQVADLENLAINACFDKILCAGVLEFCEDQARVVRNLKNVLNSNGRIIFLVPRRSVLGFVYIMFHRLNGLAIRIFSRRRIEDLLDREGLEVYEARRCALFSLVVAARKHDMSSSL
jgi:2-polyprenyl-3-methyl-5-hydroxy-6-metoxy-1,4-benzoquinol methylase